MVLDWREIALDPGFLREPGSGASRLVVWRPVESPNGSPLWERIAGAPGEVIVLAGLASVSATLLRARQRSRGFVGRLIGRFGEARGKRTLVLPDGETVEQEGERITDCLLACVQNPAGQLDEERVRSQWPTARAYQRLGPGLFLVEGCLPRDSQATDPELPPVDGHPRKQAEQALIEARNQGDRAVEATAMADLGVILLNEGRPRDAVGLLEQALTMAGPLGDASRAGDIASNLALALLYVQQPGRARPLLEQEMARARTAGDLPAEKLVAERLGLVASATGDPRGALNWFERALALTRRVGDRHQEANLLWLQAIQLAELNQRDDAIARGQEAVTLFTTLGKPQAAAYGVYLQKYRMGLFEGPPLPAPTGPGDFLGGSLVAGAMAAVPAPAAAKAPSSPPQGTTGPGLLRMALSAARSAGQFAGSGFKTTPTELQRRRIETCTSCEYHTGVRCKVCGCFTAAKSRLLHESCPLGKWPG